MAPPPTISPGDKGPGRREARRPRTTTLSRTMVPALVSAAVGRRRGDAPVPCYSEGRFGENGLTGTVITGARVVDGTGNPWQFAEVAVEGGRILAVEPPGRLPAERFAERVDGTGLVLCPGFIDIQSHSLGPLLTDGRSLSKVTQGVTTEIMGELWTPVPAGGRRTAQFHWSDPAPEILETAGQWRRFSDWLEWLERRGVSVNVGSFVGGGTVREYAMGWDGGEASEDELEAMRRVTAEAMEDGAFGIATALIYPPNVWSTERELTEVARVAGCYGGLYVTHIRSEGDQLLEALEEAIRIGASGGLPVEIYHLKATGAPNWPKMPEVIARIDRARADGVDVTADMYPYVASGTGLDVLLPRWAAEGGKLWEHLEDADTRARMRGEMLSGGVEALSYARNPSRDYVVPIGFRLPEHRQYLGLNLMEIAALRGRDWAETAMDLLRAERHRIGTMFFTMNEGNLKLQLQQPWIKVSTDAGGIDPTGQENPVHPRAYGTYPRVLGKYVREEKVLSLEQAVRIMTSAVADRLGLRSRGQIRPGFYADLVLFDPERVADRATFTDTHQLSAGIRDVWVNGERVLREGDHTGAMPGRALWGAGRAG